MTVTIQLNDALATQLQQKAAAHQLSLEEFAVRLLDGALGRLADDEWTERNRRRLELIRKSCAGSLSAEEQAELQALQAELDQRLEPLDDQLLGTLQHGQSTIGRPIASSTP